MTERQKAHAEEMCTKYSVRPGPKSKFRWWLGPPVIPREIKRRGPAKNHATPWRERRAEYLAEKSDTILRKEA
jgi:hypothetical protein